MSYKDTQKNRILGYVNGATLRDIPFGASMITTPNGVKSESECKYAKGRVIEDPCLEK